MEVIKHGKTFRETECEYCGAQIGFANRDVEHTVAKDAYGGKIHETISEFIYCPECGCRLILSLKIDGVDREIRRFK